MNRIPYFAIPAFKSKAIPWVKKPILFMFVFCFAGIIYAQEDRLICGTLKDNLGEPLIGVCIVVKGSNTGTISDINGKYCITAPLGSTLIYAYVGFTNQEVVVTTKNSEPAKRRESSPYAENIKLQSSYPASPSIQVYVDSIQESEATARFSQSTPSYSVTHLNITWINNKQADPTKITSIDYSGDNVKINLIKDEYFYLPRVDYVSSFSIENRSKLPEIQNLYAQGRPVNGISQWRGPETGEIFSWGPAIKNLEYDGSNYIFDKNGQLSLKGTGNGKSVNPYNSKNFFKNGATYHNSLKISHKNRNNEYWMIYNHKYLNGIIPNSKKRGNYFEASANHKGSKFDLSSKFIYDQSIGNMISGSPAMNSIIYSVLSTPPSFDNANGLSTSGAAKSNSSYYFTESELQRSYAPGLVNNPYWLINNISDTEKHTVTDFFVNSELQLVHNLKLVADANIEHQTFKNAFTYPQATSGILHPYSIIRSDVLSTITLASGLKYNLNSNRIILNSQLFYQYKYSGRSLNRENFLTTIDSTTRFDNIAYLQQNQISSFTTFTLFNWLPGSMSHSITTNNIYKSYKIWYAPTFSLGINFQDLLRNLWPIEVLKLRGSWGYTFSETPLAFTYGDYNLQETSSADFTSTFFSKEIILNYSLLPEKLVKKNIGFDLEMFRNRIGLTIDVYENKTLNGIFPVIENEIAVLKNIADSHTRGIDADLSFRKYGYNRRLGGMVRIIFSKYRNKVTHLENNVSEIPLAGFSDIYTALREGHPNGIIVGTAYQKDGNHNLIIGNDGFPLVDNALQIIGDPNPDFTIGFETTCNYKSLSLNILMEIQKGGQVWNGTENVLSYHGLSLKSVESRNTREYIFTGVKEDGTPNTKPVDFANPSKPFETNRWYRYGKTGVAEDAIQDASYFRIKEISTSYLLQRPKLKLTVTLFVRNPLLITKYKGMNPEASLWGKANAAGLDLFNFPTVTSTGITFKISL